MPFKKKRSLPFSGSTFKPDIALISSDCKRHLTTRVQLSVHSSVFSTMFEAAEGGKNGGVDEVELSEASGVLRPLVEFINNSSTKTLMDMEDVWCVVKAATKYEMVLVINTLHVRFLLRALHSPFDLRQDVQGVLFGMNHGFEGLVKPLAARLLANVSRHSEVAQVFDVDAGPFATEQAQLILCLDERNKKVSTLRKQRMKEVKASNTELHSKKRDKTLKCDCTNRPMIIKSLKGLFACESFSSTDYSVRSGTVSVSFLNAGAPYEVGKETCITKASSINYNSICDLNGANAEGVEQLLASMRTS